MKRLTLFFSLFGLIFAGQLNAAIDDPLQVHAKIWPQFSYDFTNGANNHLGFSMSRGQVTTSYLLSQTWLAYIKIDATTSETPQTILYQGYIQGKNLFSGKDIFRFGIQPTLFIDHFSKTMETRWLGRNLVDEAGLLGSQSGGISVLVNVMDILDVGLLVHNGAEGLTLQGDSDGQVAAELMVAATPISEKFGKIGFAGAFEIRPRSVTKTKQTYLSGRVHFLSNFIKAAIEVSLKKDGDSDSEMAFGPTINVQATKRISFFARYFTGNDEFKTGTFGKKSVLTFGPAYRFNPKLRSTVLFETSESNTAGANATQGITWRWAAVF